MGGQNSQDVQSALDDNTTTGVLALIVFMTIVRLVQRSQRSDTLDLWLTSILKE